MKTNDLRPSDTKSWDIVKHESPSKHSMATKSLVNPEHYNYYLNGSEKMVYFWDGNQWHRATKDIFGNLEWHVRLNKQPNTKFHKLIKHISI